MKRFIFAVLFIVAIAIGIVIPDANWGCSIGTPVGLLKACGDPKIRASSWSTRLPPLMAPSDFGHMKKRV